MRTAKDFIKEDEITTGTFKLGRTKVNLGEQPDGSVCFMKPNDKTVYRGFMFNKGYAVSIIKGAK